MAGNLTQKYGTANQALTCTVTSLANSGARKSAAFDNSTNLFDDVLVQATVKTNAASTTATGTVNVYVLPSVDGGTTYAENVAAGDAGVTLTVPPNARLIGVLNAVANATTYVGSFSLLAGVGYVPQSFLVVVENKTGATLDASVGAVATQGLYHQYT